MYPKLTPEEKAKRWFESGGLLTQEEKHKLLDLVADGFTPNVAIRSLNKSAATLFNTCYNDPEFKAEMAEMKNGAIAERVEEMLLEKATRTNIVVKRKYGHLYKKGELQLDENGEPIKRLISEEIQELPPCFQSQKLYLQAYRPAEYNPAHKIEVQHSEPPADPMELLALLDGTWKAVAPGVEIQTPDETIPETL
jgi:hypothetical protein